MKEEFEFPMTPVNKRSLAKRKLVYGVGVNDAKYKTTVVVEDKHYRCPYYNRWKDMLKRGYSHIVKERQPAYKDVTVCEEWHTFSTFKLWMEQQEWEGNQLDKDIIVPNNKVYSPRNLCFCQ